MGKNEQKKELIFKSEYLQPHPIQVQNFQNDGQLSWLIKDPQQEEKKIQKSFLPPHIQGKFKEKKY